MAPKCSCQFWKLDSNTYISFILQRWSECLLLPVSCWERHHLWEQGRLLPKTCCLESVQALFRSLQSEQPFFCRRCAGTQRSLWAPCFLMKRSTWFSSDLLKTRFRWEPGRFSSRSMRSLWSCVINNSIFVEYYTQFHEAGCSVPAPIFIVFSE